MTDYSPAAKQHILWIDYGKAISIYLVALLHTHCHGTCDAVINSFIMPMFFFMSGRVFGFGNNPRFKPFVAKRFRQLVIPYLWINAVAYLCWLLVLRHYGNDADGSVAWQQPLTGFLTATPPLLSHDVPLWALMAFFVTEVIYYPLYRLIKSDLIIAAAAFTMAWAMVSLVSAETVSHLPLCLAPSCLALGFYALGHYTRHPAPWVNVLLRPNFNVLLGAGVIWSWAVLANSEVEFYIASTGRFAYFLTSSLAGTLTMVQAAMFLGTFFGARRGIRVIADATLIICGFHLLMFALLKGIALLCLHLEPAQLTLTFPRAAIFAAIALTLCLPVARLRQALRQTLHKAFHRRA